MIFATDELAGAGRFEPMPKDAFAVEVEKQARANGQPDDGNRIEEKSENHRAG